MSSQKKIHLKKIEKKNTYCKGKYRSLNKRIMIQTQVYLIPKPVPQQYAEKQLPSPYVLEEKRKGILNPQQH